MRLYRLAALALAALGATLGVAQTNRMIRVVVNDTPVSFYGTGPRTVGGRVLVPLRGVFEAMGAYVDWDPSSRTITATKGTTDVKLRIGDRYATLNGLPRQLDVPATIYNATTMVPLRFVSEALGANVDYIAATREVMITSTAVLGEPPINQPPTTGLPVIDSIRHNAGTWLNPGSQVTVEMFGTPGGTAYFQIPGVVSRVNMREEDSGHYVGVWSIPNRAEYSIPSANIVGVLEYRGRQRTTRAGTSVGLDTSEPVITDVYPEPDARISNSQFSISASFADPGSGINRDTVRLIVNGRDRTSEATIRNGYITWTPRTPLPVGRNRITLEVSDRVGNNAVKSWSFDVTDGGGTSTGDFRITTDAPFDPRTGDVITVRMEGEPGGRASFTIGNSSSYPMRETSDGVYVGRYTVRSGDDLRNEIVKVRFTRPNGQVVTITGDEPIGNGTGTSNTSSAPKIITPIEGSQVKDSVAIRGTASPNGRVRVKVSYTSTILGGINTNGVLYNRIVVSDSFGRWETPAIDVDTAILGSNTRYIIEATLVDSSDREISGTSRVTISRK